MTYQEAADYKETYINVIGQDSTLPHFHYRIKYIVIAPKKSNYEERMKILDIGLHSGKGNEGALKELGLFNENMDIDIVAAFINDKFPEMLLQNYLSETGQEL
jgi:hypothetical protein